MFNDASVGRNFFQEMPASDSVFVCIHPCLPRQGSFNDCLILSLHSSLCGFVAVPCDANAVVAARKDVVRHVVAARKDVVRHVVAERKYVVRHVVAARKDVVRQVVAASKDVVRHVVAARKDVVRHVVTERKDVLRHVVAARKDVVRHVVAARKDVVRHVVAARKDVVRHVVAARKDVVRYVVRHVVGARKRRECIHSVTAPRQRDGAPFALNEYGNLSNLPDLEQDSHSDQIQSQLWRCDDDDED